MLFKQLVLSFFLILSLLPACVQMKENIVRPSASHSPVLDRILARGELVVGIAPDLPPLS